MSMSNSHICTHTHKCTIVDFWSIDFSMLMSGCGWGHEPKEIVSSSSFRASSKQKSKYGPKKVSIATHSK